MLSRDAWGHLVGTDASGQRAVGLSAIPCFPFSAGSESIALVDGAGREWALVERWSQLSDSVREELQQALNYRYLIPVVEQIVAVSQKTLPADWTFRTSSGTVTLSLRDEDAFRPLPDGRMLITDSSGFRLLIPDRERLDKSSREILRRHI